MHAFLVVQEGPHAGELHALEGDVAVVGRGDECSIRLAADGFVSRRHFQIERRDDAHYLVDLGGRNPAILNGTPSKAPTPLRPGDEIRVGTTSLKFTVPAGDRPATASASTETVALAFGDEPAGTSSIVGTSAATTRLRDVIARVSPLDATVLVSGESGTGKELVARAIHTGSPRARHALVTVNCAAIPRDLIESELFGHERGAFTGAATQRIGKFEQANQGTLFLDEIGELSPEGQAKLLRVLEDRKVTRVGGNQEIPVDVRIVAATHRDLHAMTKTNAFRLDLLYRLEVARIDLAPLRERSEDIVAIALDLCRRYAATAKRPAIALSPAAIEKLVAHDWPGNVRELRNVMERAMIFLEGTVIEDRHISLITSARAEAPPPRAGAAASSNAEPITQQRLEAALAECGGNRLRAAKLLGISRSSLYNYLERFKAAT